MKLVGLNEICNKVCMCKHLFDAFPIQNGLIQGVALLPLLFNFALGYTIRKVQDVWQDWNWMGHISFLSLQMLIFI